MKHDDKSIKQLWAQLEPVGYGDTLEYEPWPSYWERIRKLIPNFPPEACKQWLWQHYSCTTEYDWLNRDADQVQRYINDPLCGFLCSNQFFVELFSKNIIKAGEDFYLNPMDAPFIPTWSRVKSAIPDFLSRLEIAVNEDNKYYL